MDGFDMNVQELNGIVVFLSNIVVIHFADINYSGTTI
jgi:hypothetical protein